MAFQFTWSGDKLPSKKNSHRIFKKKLPTGKIQEWISPNDDYLKFEKELAADIATLGDPGKFERITCTIFSPDAKRFDLSNKWETLADAMVKAEFIEDDSVKFVRDVRIVYGGVTKDKKWRVAVDLE